MAREIAAMIREFQRADLAALKALVHKTIATCYPSRYCAEAVRFFIDYHDEEAILRDAKEGRTHGSRQSKPDSRHRHPRRR